MDRKEYYANLSKAKSMEHSAKGSSWEKKDHKYIDKKMVEGKVTYIYKEAEKAYDDLTKENMYDTSDYDYDQKIEKIKQTKEWQEIVKNDDPEYTRYDSNGKKYHDIDTYLLKKKHPILDALDDMASGRDVKTNRITKKTLAAGANDYAKIGMSYVTLASGVLAARFMYQQGSFKDEKQNAKKQVNDAVNEGSNYVAQIFKVVQQYAK